MNVLVVGYNHYGFVDAIVRGFQALPGCRATALAHDYAPVRKLHHGAFLRRWWHGRQTRALNAAVPAAVAAGAYDLVLVIEGGCLLTATVAELNARVPVALWCLDSLRRVTHDAGLLAACRQVFCFEPNDLALCPGAVYLPIAYDPTVYHPFPGTTKRHDLVWVGSAHADRLPRLEAIAALAAARGWDFAAYGAFASRPWRRRAFARQFPALARAIRRNERIPPVAANRLFNAARVVLNLHAADAPGAALNPRSFEAPGAGAALLTDRVAALPQHLEPGRDVAVFAGLDDFAEQAAYLLGQPAAAAALARAGLARVQREHQFQHRCRAMLQQLFPGRLPTPA